MQWGETWRLVLRALSAHGAVRALLGRVDDFLQRLQTARVSCSFDLTVSRRTVENSMCSVTVLTFISYPGS